MSLRPDPKVLMSIKNLQLAAKTTIDGFMNGINKSTIKGPGLEFSQYRSYQAGDDLRWLDWRMFARSDRYYIRESEMETSISVRFLIDASASMNHEDDGTKKIQYAKYLAASLAWLANLQGDATGLYVFSGHQMHVLQPRRDFQHLNRLFYQLEQLEPAGKFTQPIHYRDIYAGGHTKELLVCITDLHQQNNEIVQLLDSLNALKHEIIVFHLMGKNELELNYKAGFNALEDLETGEVIQVDLNTARQAYKEKLTAYLENTRLQMLDRRIYYRMLSMDQPLDNALRDFLNQRKKAAS